MPCVSRRLLGVAYLKALAGLARDRFESLMSSPTAHLQAHARTFALLLLLLAQTLVWLPLCARLWRPVTATVLCFWAFDVVALALELVQAILKYGGFLHPLSR